MKKTIIASAIAAVVAAPAAFADVKVSGQVGFETWDNDAATGQNSAAFNDFVVTASEDLGNGLKASIKFHTFNDMGASATNSAATANTTVAISGDFGTVMGGRFETQNNAYFHPFAALADTHALTNEDKNGQVGRGEGAGFQYTSPSFNGLTVTLAAQQAHQDADQSTASTSDNDITDVAIKYTNGPLTVALGQASYNEVSSGDQKTTNIAVKYTMGDLTVAMLNRDVENQAVAATGGASAGADNEMTTFGVKYNMGNNTIAASMIDSDDGQDGDSMLTFTHNFSKSTKAYIAIHNDDSGEDSTLIGLNKKF